VDFCNELGKFNILQGNPVSSGASEPGGDAPQDGAAALDASKILLDALVMRVLDGSSDRLGCCVLLLRDCTGDR
jgi:hypothetical protein